MKKNKLIPLSILVAGVIISGSILQSRDFSFNIFGGKGEQKEITDISPVSPNEPILGNPEASVIFIEYSDTECPFCVAFSKEREKIMSLYGEEGSIAWVYRSVSIMGSVSMQKAMALECVAEENNDYKFWNYLRDIQDKNIINPNNEEIDTSLLVSPLERFDIPTKEIVKCIEEKRYSKKIRDNIKEAKAVGAEKTPFIVILLPEKISIIQEEEIKMSLREIPASLFTIPPEKDRLIINGAVPALNIAEIIEIILPPKDVPSQLPF